MVPLYPLFSIKNFTHDVVSKFDSEPENIQRRTSHPTNLFTYVPSQINSNFTSQTFRNQFCEALEQQNHMILWDGPISKITWFLSPNSNTVICSLNSIMRFLVCWLGPWPVIWVFRVQIPPKSLITYTFTEIFKNWLFLFLSNPTLDSQYRANQLPKTVFRLSGISKLS